MPEPTSTARVATDRPARYGKQLASHLNRRAVGTWEDATDTGSIVFGEAGNRVDMTCEPDALVFALTAAPDDVALLEDVIGRHLVRFGTRDELVVSWTRADGSAGTEQRKTED